MYFILAYFDISDADQARFFSEDGLCPRRVRFSMPGKLWLGSLAKQRSKGATNPNRGGRLCVGAFARKRRGVIRRHLRLATRRSLV